MSMPTRALVALFILVGTLGLTACESNEPPPVEVTRVVTQVVELTPIPPPPGPPRAKELVICMAQEPPTVYVYGETMLTAQAIRHALYTNYITNLSYDYQADGLEKIPSLADGDAVINVVEVAAGDVVRRADDTVGTLAVGDTLVTADGQTVTFDGAPLAPHQMVVNFAMRPTVWSDGTPVSAADSVYSFNCHPANRGTRWPPPVCRRARAMIT